jgi:hypothetical protein
MLMNKSAVFDESLFQLFILQPGFAIVPLVKLELESLLL